MSMLSYKKTFQRSTSLRRSLKLIFGVSWASAILANNKNMAKSNNQANVGDLSLIIHELNVECG